MFGRLSHIVDNYGISIPIYAFLSLVDLVLTRYSMVYLGALEANPVMDFLFSKSLYSAAAFKIGIVLMVGLICIHLWEHSQVRIVLALGNLVMLTVVTYELAHILGTNYPI